VFLGITHSYSNSVYPVNGLGQLTGMTVDTTVVGHGTEQNPFRFTYSFIKNGITTSVDDSVVSPCFSQPNVNIFY